MSRAVARWAAAIVVAVSGLAVAATGALAQTERPDPQAGQRVAEKVCSACHVVRADQSALPPVEGQPAPSFAAIAGKPGTTAGSLTAFISTTHANPGAASGMPNPMLTREQVANISAYILSLRPSPR